MSRIAIFMVITRLIGFNDVTARLEFLSMVFKYQIFAQVPCFVDFPSVNQYYEVYSFFELFRKIIEYFSFGNHLIVVSMLIVPSTFCDVYRESENNNNNNNKNTKQQQLQQQPSNN